MKGYTPTVFRGARIWYILALIGASVVITFCIFPNSGVRSVKEIQKAGGFVIFAERGPWLVGGDAAAMACKLRVEYPSAI